MTGLGAAWVRVKKWLKFSCEQWACMFLLNFFIFDEYSRLWPCVPQKRVGCVFVCVDESILESSENPIKAPALYWRKMDRDNPPFNLPWRKKCTKCALEWAVFALYKKFRQVWRWGLPHFGKKIHIYCGA